MASARRCALCFGFDGDLNRKKGQIAHIDQNPSNAEDRNLVYLCVEHHDEYDSTTSQVKGITEAELRDYKARLISAIANGEHLRSVAPQSDATTRADAIRGHDERLFLRGDDLLKESFLREFLQQLTSDDSYYISGVHRLDEFRSVFSETGNQFIDAVLSVKLRDLIGNIDALLLFLARHFFVYPKDQQRDDDLRLCMHPELNWDRNEDGTPGPGYDRLQANLDTAVDAVRTAYDEFRTSVKLYLFL
jgi:hypothetical protein